MSCKLKFVHGGWDTGVGRPRSIMPNSRFLIEKPWPAKPTTTIVKLYNKKYNGPMFVERKGSLLSFVYIFGWVARQCC